jgi:hypothetical protein
MEGEKERKARKERKKSGVSTEGVYGGRTHIMDTKPRVQKKRPLLKLKKDTSVYQYSTRG